MRALVLDALGRFEESLRDNRRANDLDPGNPYICNYLGHNLMHLGRDDEALPWFDRALQVRPDFVEVLNNKAFALVRGARVILVVDQALCPLLSRLSGVSECLPRSSSIVVPPFDFHIAIDSLPLAFGTRLDSIPASEGYLPPPDADRAQAWESRLGPHERLRVGLVWSGNPRHVNDRNRSMPLQTMLRILDVDAMFVSLQKDPRPQDADVLRGRTEIVDCSRDLTDFAETAALMSCLDLVITVDTSVAHLAAALGRPTWILLPRSPDFRWLLDRDDSPWYPTVRLFRQSETRDYASVAERVRTELVAVAAKHVEARRVTDGSK